jgi:hypothetical protein
MVCLRQWGCAALTATAAVASNTHAGRVPLPLGDVLISPQTSNMIRDGARAERGLQKVKWDSGGAGVPPTPLQCPGELMTQGEAHTSCHAHVCLKSAAIL